MKMDYTLISIVVAIVGLIITVFLAWNYNRKKLRVHLDAKIMTDGNFNIHGVVLCIEGVNHGTRPITIRSIGVQLPNKTSLFPTQLLAQLPKTLKDGDYIEAYLDYQETKNAIRTNYSGPVKIKGFFTDELGKRYFSNKYNIQLK